MAWGRYLSYIGSMQELSAIDKIRYGLSQLHPIPDEEWAKFEQMLRPMNYYKDDNIINVGDTECILGFIDSGLIRFYFTTFEGNEYNQTFKTEGEFFMNYYSALSNTPSPFTIQALEDTTMHVADFKQVQGLYEQHSCWQIIGRKLAENNYMTKCEREMQLLLFDAKQRYLNFMEKRPDLAQRLTQMHLALYLGINPSSLNRLIKKLENTDE